MLQPLTHPAPSSPRRVLPLFGGLHRRRVLAAHERTARRREHLAHWLDGVDAGTFARNGFLLKRGLLPADAFDTLREQLRALLANGPQHRAVDASLRRAVPALAALLDGRAWAGMTRYVAGTDRPAAAWVDAAQVADAGAADDADDPPQAPRDLQTLLHSDAWQPRMKAWYFLTDVEHDDAPLCYVPGSHRLTPARLAWEQARGRRGVDRVDKDELAAMGLGKPTRLVVPANTLIVADAFGFHKRARPRRPGWRLEVCAGQ